MGDVRLPRHTGHTGRIKEGESDQLVCDLLSSLLPPYDGGGVSGPKSRNIKRRSPFEERCTQGPVLTSFKSCSVRSRKEPISVSRNRDAAIASCSAAAVLRSVPLYSFPRAR